MSFDATVPRKVIIPYVDLRQWPEKEFFSSEDFGVFEKPVSSKSPFQNLPLPDDAINVCFGTKTNKVCYIINKGVEWFTIPKQFPIDAKTRIRNVDFFFPQRIYDSENDVIKYYIKVNNNFEGLTFRVPKSQKDEFDQVCFMPTQDICGTKMCSYEAQKLSCSSEACESQLIQKEKTCTFAREPTFHPEDYFGPETKQ